MCGIVGLVDFSKKIDEQTLHLASAKLKHRGGNGNGFLFEKLENCNIGLANERLATIDLSDEGLQPFTSTCGNYTITFNGTLYNYLELKAELETLGISFRSQSDTEVLLEAYKYWDVEFLDNIDAVFALVIFDKPKNQLLIARDQLGVKPLYLYQNDEYFAFGSEIKALLEFPITREIDKNALASYFRNGYFKTANTIFKGISHFPKGFYGTIDLNNGKLERQSFVATDKSLQPEKLDIDLVEQLLNDSIAKRRRTNANWGVLLSGGYDSTAVASLLKHQGENLKTFTLGFESASFDESKDAEKIANHLQTKHREYILTAEDAVKVVKELPTIYDEPMGDSGVIPLTYIAEQVAKENIQVLLGAEGGDEIFGGYTEYLQAVKFYNIKKRIPKILGSALAKLFPSKKDKLNEILNAESLIETYVALRAYFSEREIDSLLNIELKEKTIKGDKLRNLLDYDIDNYLSYDLLLKSDRSCMHHGIDNRDSLLSTKLVNYLSKIDGNDLISNGELKSVLKSIVHKHVPKEFMDRPKKGFSIPIADWMQTTFKPLVSEYLSEKKVEESKILDFQTVQLILDGFYLKGNQSNAKKIWLLLQFQMWHEKWMN